MNHEFLLPWRRLSRLVTLTMMGFVTSLGVEILVPIDLRSMAIAQPSAELCPSPALARLQTHQVTSGETLDRIAADYGLLPVTLLAMNPAIQGSLTAGTTLRIPPFNGVEVTVSAGQTWQDIATAYRVRADVLFEINGCPDTIPERIFVPGVSWLLDTAEAAEASSEAEAMAADPLATFPLAQAGTILAGYGWQTDPSRDELVFSSGITLETEMGTDVLAAGAGTVAYVGEEVGLGTLIVINHDQGFQTRYAQIVEPQVAAGDRVNAGQRIATASPDSAEDNTALLYFEVRTNSALGWVARDPGNYIPELAIR
jgi:murein DD-endopeptidase MepM/ murein hydrolase activator NlpD